MVTVQIDENTPAGKKILSEIAKNPQIGHIENFELDLNENPIGYVTVDEYFSRLKATVKRKYQEKVHEGL